MYRSVASLAWVLALGQARADPHVYALPELEQRARQNDLRVQEADDQLHVLEAQYKQAYWAWFPNFETTFTFAGPTPESRNDGLGGPPRPGVPSTLEYDLNFGTPGVLFGVGTKAILPIYTFGKLTALREAGEHGVAVGEQLRRRAQDEAAFQAAEAYYGYQLARQGRASLEDSLKQIDDAAASLEKMLAQESAQVTKIDKYKVAFFRKQVESRLGQADKGMELARQALRLIAGFRPDEPLELAQEDLSEPEVNLQPVAYYLDLAAHERPEVKALRAGVEAKQREVFIRERAFFPDFGVAGFFHWSWATNTTRQRSPFAYDPFDDLSGGVGVVFHQTFDFPIKAAQLDQARAEFDKLQTDRKLASEAMQLEVRQVYGDLREAIDRARNQGDAEKKARSWATAANASFELGTTDTRDLMESLLALGVASTEKLTARHDALVGLRALSRVSGVEVGAGVRHAP